jgi:hypothetical protein
VVPFVGLAEGFLLLLVSLVNVSEQLC